MRRRSRHRNTFSAEHLETREVLSSLSLTPDLFQAQLPADASSFPDASINVLENDVGADLRITDLSAPQLGTVELLAASGASGQGLVKYIPGPEFRGKDVFSYVVTDATGATATASVFVQFEQDTAPYTWEVQAAGEVLAEGGVKTPLESSDGRPAVQVNYSGDLLASVGVLLRWSFVSDSFSGLQFPGDFTTDTIRTDAALYAFNDGSAWIVGSIEGVNAILADVEYVPSRGYSAPEGVVLNVQSHLYSSIGVNVGTDLRSLTIRVQQPEFSPQTVDDLFSVRTSSEASFLDVLANDESGVDSNVLELVDFELGGHSQATLSIDSQTQQLVYRPPAGFMGTDVIVYTTRNAEGIEAQGRVEVNVMPPILAVLSTTSNSTMVDVINAETMSVISQFQAFSKVAADSIVEVADLDSDGFVEIVVLQVSGERRMRTFNVYGGMLSDTVMQPFGRRFSGAMDLSIGDLDDDGKAEMVVTGATFRGYEVRAIDSVTGLTEQTMTISGMTGAPQVAVNEESDEIVVIGRTSGGGVGMAMMDVDSIAPQRISRRTLISDREAATMQRVTGAITSLTLSTADVDGNGATEAVVGMIFRNGAARVMTAGSTGALKTMFSNRVASGTRSLVLTSSSLFEDSGSMVGWWSNTSLGMLGSSTMQMQRRRINGVALG
ncbi:MAG: Ig-like domain-containing protein [Planctomycetota bacterium]